MGETNSNTTQEELEPIPDTVFESKPAETPVTAPAPATASAAAPAATPSWFGIVVLCVLVSVASSIATIAAYDSWYAQKLVAVDIKGYISDQRDKYIAGKLTDDELKRSFDKLEQVVTAIPKNKAVLMGDLVVRNVEVVKP